MDEEFISGSFVAHASFGVGKVLTRDGDRLRIYFKSHSEPNPDRRVREFKLPSPFLSPAAHVADEELDNLPPWKDGQFQRARTPLDLDKAKQTFLRHFPQGFADPRFEMAELAYKRSAHQRYHVLFRSRVDGWIAEGNGEAIAQALEAVYGDRKVPIHEHDTRLNLLYQRVDEPAFFDALAQGGAATVEYAAATVQWVEAGGEDSFNRYLRALAALPTRPGGKRVDSWTTATWLPFIAAPDRHLVIKPTIVQAFASMLPFDLQYRAEVNFASYARMTRMAAQLGRVLEVSELNLSRRPLDMIDVQSFMWAVERW